MPALGCGCCCYSGFPSYYCAPSQPFHSLKSEAVADARSSKPELMEAHHGICMRSMFKGAAMVMVMAWYQVSNYPEEHVDGLSLKHYQQY